MGSHGKLENCLQFNRQLLCAVLSVKSLTGMPRRLGIPPLTLPVHAEPVLITVPNVSPFLGHNGLFPGLSDT